MKLSGNTILITGGSSGIGLTLAKRFVELDNHVIVTGRNAQKLEALAQTEPKLERVQFDVSNPAAIQGARDQVVASHPQLNVLVNCAGVFRYLNVSRTEEDLEGLTSEIDINLKGALHTTSAFIDVLKKNRGTIINVSSGLAYVPLQCSPVYCATKAGLHSYSIALRQQLEPHGVEVVELMPPATRTALTADLPEGGAFKLMETSDLIDATIAGLKAGKREIRPGQSNQLHWTSRIMPGFIQGQLAKGSQELIPD